MAKRSNVSRSRRRLVIMVKEPVAGRVKTRLGRDVGAAAAAMFYRHTMSHVVTRLAIDRRWSTELSVAPAAALWARALPPNLTRHPQIDGAIGARMQAIFETGPPGPVVIIGTDIPAVRSSAIAAAFRALGSHDLVFGPATDGGFWLVGMRRTPCTIDAFRDVRWSSEYTLSDCLAGLCAHRVALVEMLRDVDNIGDLKALRHIVGRRNLPIFPPAN